MNSAGPITLKRATIVGMLALWLTSGCGSLSVAVRNLAAMVMLTGEMNAPS